MAVNNLLVEVKNAVLIAQAGIQGTLASLKQLQAEAAALPHAIKRTFKKSTTLRITRKPKAKRKARTVGQSSKARTRKRPTRAR
jgi:hypothetical protein